MKIEQVSPYLPNDSEWDHPDYTQAIEVMTMLGDTVIDVRHLKKHLPEKFNPRTMIMIVVGWGLFIIGIGASIACSTGLGILFLILGLMLGI